MTRKELCKVLGNEERLYLVICLVKAQTVSDILARCHLSQSALSQHLRILRDAEVERTEKVGKFVVYQVSDQEVVKIAKLVLAYR